jgi:hypothetical protein
MKKVQFAFRILLLAFIWETGCATKPIPDPIAGWKGGTTAYEGSPYAKAITDDYLDYVQKLPPEEKKYVKDYKVRFFEDRTGQHAVKISIPLDGIWWEHVLIYDKDNKRTKVIRYAGSHYRS